LEMEQLRAWTLYFEAISSFLALVSTLFTITSLELASKTLL
jgi:hypothetical protein